MIKNELQYRVTQSQMTKLENALAQFKKELDNNKEVHPLLLKAQQDALQSQIDELSEDIKEYQSLISGEQTVIELTSLDELPTALIKARIASGLTQKALAQRLKIKEQQIQRYEATEYASASFSRMLAIIKVLGIKIKEDVLCINLKLN